MRLRILFISLAIFCLLVWIGLYILMLQNPLLGAILGLVTILMMVVGIGALAFTVGFVVLYAMGKG